MFERPFERAMHDQIGIAPDRRGEMRVLVEGQREMPKRIDRVARLLERTQHQVRQDALLGLARNFLRKALIMLRPNLKFGRSGKRHHHGAFPRAVIAAASTRPSLRRRAAMAHGDVPLRQPRDAQRIAESLGHFFELQHLLRIGLFVHAIQRA